MGDLPEHIIPTKKYHDRAEEISKLPHDDALYQIYKMTEDAYIKASVAITKQLEEELRIIIDGMTLTIDDMPQKVISYSGALNKIGYIDTAFALRHVIEASDIAQEDKIKLMLCI